MAEHEKARLPLPDQLTQSFSVAVRSVFRKLRRIDREYLVKFRCGYFGGKAGRVAGEYNGRNV